MCDAIYGDVCAICLAQCLFRQADDLWMLRERAPSLCETASPERGKRPTEERSRRHTILKFPVETSALLSGWGYV